MAVSSLVLNFGVVCGFYAGAFVFLLQIHYALKPAKTRNNLKRTLHAKGKAELYKKIVTVLFYILFALANIEFLFSLANKYYR